MSSPTSKFIDTIHYILDSRSGKSPMESESIHAAVWFSDAISFLTHGMSISGESFVRGPLGPIPRHVNAAISVLQSSHRIFEITPRFGWQPRRFVSCRAHNTHALSRYEKDILDYVIHELRESADGLSIGIMNHRNLWSIADIGEEIPLECVFASCPGDIAASDLLWADAVLDRQSAGIDPS